MHVQSPECEDMKGYSLVGKLALLDSFNRLMFKPHFQFALCTFQGWNTYEIRLQDKSRKMILLKYLFNQNWSNLLQLNLTLIYVSNLIQMTWCSDALCFLLSWDVAWGDFYGVRQRSLRCHWAWLCLIRLLSNHRIVRDSQGLTGILTAFRPWKWRSFELCCVISIRVTTSAQNTLTKHGDQNRIEK